MRGRTLFAVVVAIYLFLLAPLLIVVAVSFDPTDAFRFPLAGKARRFDAELQQDFLDPIAPMVPDGLQASGAIQPSGDAALWNALRRELWPYRHPFWGGVTSPAIYALRSLRTRWGRRA